MTQWEHKSETVATGAISETMIARGLEGWELVQVEFAIKDSDSLLIWKRPIRMQDVPRFDPCPECGEQVNQVRNEIDPTALWPKFDINEPVEYERRVIVGPCGHRVNCEGRTDFEVDEKLNSSQYVRYVFTKYEPAGQAV